MNYSEQEFRLNLSGKTLTFAGKLEKADYSEVDAFLRSVDQVLSDENCVINLEKLVFLNSSGIRSLATFILGSPKTFEIHINPNVTWQTESIPALKHLKSRGITIVS